MIVHAHDESAGSGAAACATALAVLRTRIICRVRPQNGLRPGRRPRPLDPLPAKSGKIYRCVCFRRHRLLDDRIAASVTMWMMQHDFAELSPRGLAQRSPIRIVDSARRIDRELIETLRQMIRDREAVTAGAAVVRRMSSITQISTLTRDPWRAAQLAESKAEQARLERPAGTTRWRITWAARQSELGISWTDLLLVYRTRWQLRPCRWRAQCRAGSPKPPHS